MGGRQIVGVKDILDADRNAGKQAGAAGRLRVQADPGADAFVAGRDPRQAGGAQGLGGQVARGHLRKGLGGGQGGGAVWGVNHLGLFR